MSNMSMSVNPSTSGGLNVNDPFQSRTLSPLEPNHHHLYPYNSARRGSITDPALHLSVGNDFGRRFSQPDMNLPMPSSSSPLSERRGSVATDYSSQPPSPSMLNKPGPLDNRPDLMHLGQRRESLPSIALPPAPVGGFDAFQRRHSIAVTEFQGQNNSPMSSFKRKGE
ncbi:hypothetical protein BC936DRAFT_144138 [Jimgerdemannia flammicorona]|uniref:Uncharacterized protein n=1 Tax=Jimgerdemannia flammicorona TaxID=994334 RepID=A0A432ZY32_9FUNG|nr:hypothetical protein BC936DRAFT_144138 [Jimgerdemannia flammicorona]